MKATKYTHRMLISFVNYTLLMESFFSYKMRIFFWSLYFVTLLCSNYNFFNRVASCFKTNLLRTVIKVWHLEYSSTMKLVCKIRSSLTHKPTKTCIFSIDICENNIPYGACINGCTCTTTIARTVIVEHAKCVHNRGLYTHIFTIFANYFIVV